MNLTAEQQQAVRAGHAVPVNVGNVECMVMRKDVYERGEEFDYTPWTDEEIELLASEAADLLAGDGLDEPDEPTAP